MALLSSSILEVERISFVSGSIAVRSILVRAEWSIKPVGNRESADQGEPGKTAGTIGKPQERSRGESGPKEISCAKGAVQYTGRGEGSVEPCSKSRRLHEV